MRIRLHPHDAYALGPSRGAIVERWFSSTIEADNGPLTAPNEGLAIASDSEGEILFRDIVDTLGSDIVGTDIWDKHRSWPMFAKFFDYNEALPFHVHQDDEHAADVGRRGKPEAHYIPPELNNHSGKSSTAFLGLQPDVTGEQLGAYLGRIATGDNRITELSVGYNVALGEAWYVPPGVLHAPASYCTYEPQAASDVFAMCQLVVSGECLTEDTVWKDVPPDRRGDVNYLLEIVDLARNTDPDFASKHRMPRIPVAGTEEEAFDSHWISYRGSGFSAQEIRIPAGETATLVDPVPYGFIVLQGFGTVGPLPLEASTIVRHGEETHDEFFVSAVAAPEGVEIRNESRQDLVLLRHFGPGHPSLPIQQEH